MRDPQKPCNKTIFFFYVFLFFIARLFLVLLHKESVVLRSRLLVLQNYSNYAFIASKS